MKSEEMERITTILNDIEHINRFNGTKLKKDISIDVETGLARLAAITIPITISVAISVSFGITVAIKLADF